MNKVLISDVFFTAAIVLLVLASLSKLLAWSIHKRHALGKMEENLTDIEKAKLVLKKAFVYLSILGCISAAISLVLAL